MLTYLLVARRSAGAMHGGRGGGTRQDLGCGPDASRLADAAPARRRRCRGKHPHLACCRSGARPAHAVAADRVRHRHRHLLHGGARAEPDRRGGALHRSCRCRGPGARPADRLSAAAGARRGCSRICHRDAQERAGRASDPATADLERLNHGLDRGTRGARALRPHRRQGARHRGNAPEGAARARAGVGAQGVGAFVAFKARLDPPRAPWRPGGYDFTRDLYFQNIGATGLVLGAIRTAEAPGPPGAWLRYAAFIDGIRNAIDRRIRASLPGDTGAIASALITGKRDATTERVNQAMYDSSLAHVLSISGYHMAVVAGVVFFAVRALLALVPVLALRHPIKKWAAAAALVAAAFYLLLSGAEVATQRAFIMTAIVLVGVMVDRPALTLRNLALAALGVLLLAPEAVVHPSFQMSFAATLALVAVYERGLPWMTAGADTPLGARIALWGGREILALILASLVAGLATTLYAAYHFHRLAPYGVLANLLAMPMVSLVAMPSGLLALVALPFGFDGPLWRLMGVGIDWMIAVALWVSALPGAVGRIAA